MIIPATANCYEMSTVEDPTRIIEWFCIIYYLIFNKFVNIKIKPWHDSPEQM